MDLTDVRHGRTRHEAENIRKNLKNLVDQENDNELVELFRGFRVDCHSLSKELMSRSSHDKVEDLEGFFEGILNPNVELTTDDAT